MNIAPDLADDLRQAFRRIDASVAVVTTGAGAARIAMTATSYASVSLDPPTLLVCVNRASRLHAAILAERGYRLNVLTCDQAAIARACAGGDIAERFGFGRWTDDARGPRLDGALASIGCALTDAIESGSHSIFLGAVEDVAFQENRALLYGNGAFRAA